MWLCGGHTWPGIFLEALHRSFELRVIYKTNHLSIQMRVSKNRCTPKSSILMWFSIINHPFWGSLFFWKHPNGSQLRRLVQQTLDLTCGSLSGKETTCWCKTAPPPKKKTQTDGKSSWNQKLTQDGFVSSFQK